MIFVAFVRIFTTSVVNRFVFSVCLLGWQRSPFRLSLLFVLYLRFLFHGVVPCVDGLKIFNPTSSLVRQAGRPDGFQSPLRFSEG